MSPLRHIFLQLYKVPCLHLQNSATGYFNNVISSCQNMLNKNFLWHLILIKIYVALWQNSCMYDIKYFFLCPNKFLLFLQRRLKSLQSQNACTTTKPNLLGKGSTYVYNQQLFLVIQILNYVFIVKLLPGFTKYLQELL